MAENTKGSDLVWARVRDGSPREVPGDVARVRDHAIMDYYRSQQAIAPERELLTVQPSAISRLWDDAWRAGINQRDIELVPLEEDNERMSRVINNLTEELRASEMVNQGLRKELAGRKRRR